MYKYIETTDVRGAVTFPIYYTDERGSTLMAISFYEKDAQMIVDALNAAKERKEAAE